jgi:hypothetical protein
MAEPFRFEEKSFVQNIHHRSNATKAVVGASRLSLGEHDTVLSGIRFHYNEASPAPIYSEILAISV